MAPKCKKGYKKVGSMCVSKKTYKKFGKFSDEVTVMKLAIIGAVTSVGGWSVFKGVVDLTGLEDLNGFIMILIGLCVIGLTYKLGFSKLKWESSN